MQYFTRKEVSELLGIPLSTLAYWRSANTGIPSFKLGGRVFYRKDAIEQWVKDQERLTLRGDVA